MVTVLKPVGTRFPFINLEKAIGRAKELFDADQKGREMTITGAFGVWGYSDKSSGGFQTIAALKMYSLVKDSNGGDSRKIGLTDSALWYFRDERDDEKKKLAREFALAPKLIAALWHEWQASPPADPVARSHLKAERGLNDQGARSLLAIYKENLTFAELKAGDKVSLVETEQEEPELSAPRMPVSTDLSSYVEAKRFLNPPPASTVLQEMFNLDEGPVTLTYPANISIDSFNDLEAYFELFLRRERRRARRDVLMQPDADPTEEAAH